MFLIGEIKYKRKMNFFVIIISFCVVWTFIEIVFSITKKMTTPNYSGISHNQFMWNLRIIAIILFVSSLAVMNSFNINLKEFLIMCII